MTETDVLIVGAGHNGLTAGCYLAREGLKVLVVESTDKVGGMTSTNPVLAKAPGHRVNEGAMDSSLWRTTRIPEELGLTRFGLREIEVDPPYAYLDGDGSTLCIHRDPIRTAEEIARYSRADSKAYLELANTLEAAMNVVVPFMNTNPMRPALGGIAGGALKSALGSIRDPSRLGPMAHFFSASHAEFVSERFTDRRIKALLAALPCFAPMFEDGTAWVMIYFGLIHRAGVGRFIGGTGALTDALARCYASLGGEVRLNSVVEGLTMRGGKVTGVRLDDGTELTAKKVITTNNVRIPLTEWLPDGALPDNLAERVSHIPTDSTSGSSFKVDVALRGRLELSAHQADRTDGVDLRASALVWTTFEDHVQAWHDCARGVVPDPMPGVAIIPTGADPSQAPDGQDTFWFWSGISPAHPTRPWGELAAPTSERVLATASKYLDGLGELEIDRQVMTPDDFEERFRSPNGNVYHVDPTATRFGPLRPAAGFAGYRTPVDGLFLSGGGTHPSAGICGVPGQQAARAVLRDLRGKSLTRAFRRSR